MIVLFKGIDYPHVLIFDAEYNEGHLIQFAGVLFRKIEEDTYQIEKSLNIYVKLEEGKVNPFIREFTGITDNFLNKYGETLEEAQKQIYEMIDIESEKLLVVSHGLVNDRMTLLNNNIDFYFGKDEKEITGHCTYSAAKSIFQRDKKLSLQDISLESGIFLGNDHSAFHDAIATISVFCLVCKLDEERKNEKLLPPKRD
jgi:DNA polymerase III epsilon subunit-like protein